MLERHRAPLAAAVLGAALALLVNAFVVPWFHDDHAPEDGELVILSGRDDGYGHQRQALVDQWNALHPRNPARIEELAAVADAQRSEMVARAQGGGQGDADIYNLDVTWTAEFASQGYIRRLDDADPAGFLQHPLDTCRYDGKLWALPFNTDAGLLYYRDNYVGTAPTSWPQLVAQSQSVLTGFGALTADGTRPTAGYAGQLADYEGLTVNALEAIWAANGDVVDAGGRVVIDSPEAQEGLHRLAEGLNRSAPQVILPESAGFDEQAATQAFAEGKVLFMRNWPVAHRTLDPPPAVAPAPGATPGPAAPPADTRPALEFAVTRLPGPSALGGQNLAVSAHSRHPNAARQLIEFLTSERSQQILFERGGFAATREIVYRDAEVVALYRYAPTLLEAIRTARTRPVTPHYALFSETFRAIVRQALADGGQLPADAKPRLEAALKGYKR
ncbi:extracellular solute-binding protein [Dactylosporangium matsuzakiense]|uniref:ABC transporter substrate-binding protein n=1 Tax=Dactylosporangium matsuzakiense TaxID=53360 RepID=A0A9W6KLT8_9ACTN|nr:extracellular solute-binding protein [Dactylosporangium matsuzakiense]UWZ42673.1 extracellular solute-binding protein [Dactylosporangium matsuzakiense]GLL03848.1 ABC transporter substrate-binding protein [Dactylosporangium matsuzakiense]